MKNRLLNHTLAVPLLILALAIIGCDSQNKLDQDTVAQTGHEGHDHGPEGHDATTSSETKPPASDWCIEHSVPESECTKCSPALIADFKATGDWCAGHDIPESHCRLCNPELIFPQEEVLRARTIQLAEHEIDISLNFRQNAAACATDGALIQFASAGTGERAGITVRTVHSSAHESAIEVPAEIRFDETETYVVTTTLPALVSRWLVSPGDKVEQGQPLAMLQSPEIAELRKELITTNADFEVEEKELKRHLEMKERELISEADFDLQSARTQQARAAMVSAQGMLLAAGLNEDDITVILNEGDLSNQFILRSQESGMVIDRTAQLGDLMTAGQALATIGEPDALWIEARLTERQIREVKIGQMMTFSSDGAGFGRVGGEIIWVSRFLDPQTRTGTVRARVLDGNHRLTAGEFGRANIVTVGQGQITMVPQDAVQWEGCCNVVFVKEAVDRFRPRKVNILDSDGPFYQISKGVQGGEEVVVGGAFLLKTELKKSSIGAGCCGLDPAG